MLNTCNTSDVLQKLDLAMQSVSWYLSRVPIFAASPGMLQHTAMLVTTSVAVAGKAAVNVACCCTHDLQSVSSAIPFNHWMWHGKLSIMAAEQHFTAMSFYAIIACSVQPMTLMA